MGTRANYIVTGAFTLAVIVGVFGFIRWFQNTAGGGERSSYRVEFVGSVSGLRTGSAVLFNGIRVGRVSGLGLESRRGRVQPGGSPLRELAGDGARDSAASYRRNPPGVSLFASNAREHRRRNDAGLRPLR